MSKLLTKAAIEREFKAETDAAWSVMTKRWERAQAKRERQLKALMEKDKK